ncbi:EAL domain-containing protein [Rugamonas sp.]|uniref:putative bifunctional diguanylate cyclase/phosphodiesterase n=1 Tax=Rugamonas sp. TaxID=1926287 RepID=UPI0025EE38E7|nr:EAL domain-containing protein [Rugamonas sp.]
MSTDANQYAYLSVMADAILSAILIFLWRMQRKERHALFWGLGQLSIMAATAFWFMPSDFLGATLRGILCAVLLSCGVAGYWYGTRYFIGKDGGGRRTLLAWAALAGALLLVALEADPAVALPLSALVLGPILFWSGWTLAHGAHRYRLLGASMMLRGCFTLGGVAGLVPQAYLYWFLCATVLKSVSVLGLIYAVLHEIAQRYGRTIDSLSDGFLIRDRAGYIHVANDRCAQLLGFGAASELLGRHVCELLPGLSRRSADDYFARFAAPATVYPMTDETVFKLRDGQLLPVEMLGSPYTERGQLYCMIQLLDISARKAKDAELLRAARVDPVTGYANRHALTQQLAQLVAQRAADGRRCAVLFVDLDKFKRVNDSFGHAAGDDLLRKVADRLCRQLGEGDVLARFGGDEFIVLLPDLAPDACEAAARERGQRILSVMAQSFDLSHHAIGVSASIGVACYPQHGADPETLIRHADIAMYEAKKAGRSELRVFNDAMNAAATDALVIDGALRQAIAGDEFHLVYQAITDAHTGQLKKVEALLRWTSEKLGPVAPDRFIPVAEDSGMINAIGTWVLREACRQVAQWKQGALGEIIISINVSAWQLADPGFVALVAEALAVNGLAAHQLELELTERVLIDDGANVHAVLAQLRALGVSISLDDFGTGYSSLSYLTHFQLNTLKIDRAFVMDIEHSERSNSLVHAIIAMGHSLGLQLVAEGVETAGQARILEQMGCHYLQGYHISRPVLPADMLAFAGRRPATMGQETAAAFSAVA